MDKKISISHYLQEDLGSIKHIHVSLTHELDDIKSRIEQTGNSNGNVTVVIQNEMNLFPQFEPNLI